MCLNGQNPVMFLTYKIEIGTSCCNMTIAKPLTSNATFQFQFYFIIQALQDPFIHNFGHTMFHLKKIQGLLGHVTRPGPTLAKYWKQLPDCPVLPAVSIIKTTPHIINAQSQFHELFGVDDSFQVAGELDLKGFAVNTVNIRVNLHKL